jgi:UDP-N-acetylglucosamine 2-epimerase
MNDQKKIIIVHGTRPNAGKSYCGVYAMRASDNKALVTCKTCLRLIKEAEVHWDMLKTSQAKYEASLGLTQEEKGTL